MKYISILLMLALPAYLLSKPEREQLINKFPASEKPQPSKQFPKHWGAPPKIQTRDMVKLPGNFGKGSSTLARWISENLKKDESKPPANRPKPPADKPKPPIEPILPIAPEPPKEIKAKIAKYQKAQKNLQDGLRKKIQELGERPSREEVRKTVDLYNKENEKIIKSQREIGKEISDWHKENKPKRPARPEPSLEVREKIESVKEKKKSLEEVRKLFHERLKNSKNLTKEQKEGLVSEFKESSKEKHKELKEAQKALQGEIRSKVQTGARRE